MAKAVLRMNKARAEELLAPLLKGTAEGISQHWQARMIEALEYVIENETTAQQAAQQADGKVDEFDEVLQQLDPHVAKYIRETRRR